VGGLGHLAVQYARAMGLEVVAIDIGDDKLELARRLGAAVAIDARSPDAVAAVLDATRGGVHGALVTAVSRDAFRQTLGMLRSGGTCALVGLPPGDFPAPIFDIVLKRLTIRGSIVGTRLDLREALDFAAAGKVTATVETQPFDQVNEVIARLRGGNVGGRIALQLG
jgi:propanol-preferring alcohol dehydrogenase